MVQVQVKKVNVKRHKTFKILRLGISYIVLIIMAIASILPVYYILIAALIKAPNLVSVTTSGLLPKHVYLTAFSQLFATSFFGANFLMWFRNSLILASSTSIISILLALVTGYAMSRLDIPAKSILVMFLYIITFFPFTAMALAVYLFFAKLHLVNYIGLVIAYSAGTSIYNAFIAKISIDAIPISYEEVAMVDGLSRFQVFLRIVMRFALPIVALVAVSAFNAAYLDFAIAYTFLVGNSRLWTGIIALTYLAGLENPTAPPAYYLFAAGVFILAIPSIVLFVVSFRMMTQAFSAMAGVKQ